MYTNGNAMPPDYRGMAPASCSTWLRFVGGPSGWFRPMDKSTHKAWDHVEKSDSVAEVLWLCDLWLPDWKDRRHDPR